METDSEKAIKRDLRALQILVTELCDEASNAREFFGDDVDDTDAYYAAHGLSEAEGKVRMMLPNRGHPHTVALSDAPSPAEELARDLVQRRLRVYSTLFELQEVLFCKNGHTMAESIELLPRLEAAFAQLQK